MDPLLNKENRNVMNFGHTICPFEYLARSVDALFPCFPGVYGY